MSIIMILVALLVISTIIFGMICTVKTIKGERIKTFLGVNVSTALLLMIVATVVCLSGTKAFAESPEVAASASAGLGYIGAALSTGLATIGAGIAVAVSASAALGAISEDSKLLGKTLIFVGLAEGIAIYGLIVSILILGKL